MQYGIAWPMHLEKRGVATGLRVPSAVSVSYIGETKDLLNIGKRTLHGGLNLVF